MPGKKTLQICIMTATGVDRVGIVDNTQRENLNNESTG